MLKSLLDVPRDQIRAMTAEEAMLYISCASQEFSGAPFTPFVPEQYFREKHKLLTPEAVQAWGHSFPFLLLHQRLSFYSPKQITAALAEFIVVLTGGHPGKLVMYAYAVHRAKFEGVLSMGGFANLFPDGFPTDRALQRSWEMQKSTVAGQDNLLDLASTWL